MQNIVEFLKKYNHWFLFVILEAVALLLLFQFNKYQGSVWFTTANTVSAKVYEMTSAVEQYFSLTKVNEDLTQRNITLERELAVMRQKMEAMGADSTMIASIKGSMGEGISMIPAKVVSNSIDRRDNFMTIDKGEADGVKPDMGVVCGTGLVGIVYQTTAHYSVVIPILSSHSKISCCLEGRGYFGYLRWDGGSARTAYLDNVPRHAHFKLYDRVVTSGYSSVFPRGIQVGKVLHVYNSPDGLSYRMQVELSTDFSRVRSVCVINDVTAKERLEAIRAAGDSIKVSKEGE